MSEESISIESNTSVCFYEYFEENEINDLISSIFELIDEYLNSEILKMSKLDFHNEMVDDITHIIFQNLQDADIIDNSDYDCLYDFIYTQCTLYFENREDLNFPERSIDHCIYNYHREQYGLTEEFVNSYLTNKIVNLRKLNEASPKQRTPEWYQMRYNMMTASNLWQALNTDAQRNRLIFDKCKPLDFGYSENKWVNTDNSLHWGVKYEPLTVMVYEKMTGAKVEEFGCIRHEKYPFIGASPDGIVTNIESPLYCRMLEIKNIYNRDMDGIPSEAYWIQMQMQMECCDMDICDFVETRFKEYANDTEFFEETDNERMRGVILHFIPNDGKSNAPLYKYMPLDILLNKDDMDVWITQCKNELPEHAIYAKKYWYLHDIQMTTIVRNKKWFEAALPIIKNTWVTIEQERVSGYEHRAAKKRVINDVIVINSDNGSESHIIKNMPSNGTGVCIIKIDSLDK